MFGRLSTEEKTVIRTTNLKKQNYDNIWELYFSATRPKDLEFYSFFYFVVGEYGMNSKFKIPICSAKWRETVEKLIFANRRLCCPAKPKRGNSSETNFTVWPILWNNVVLCAH